MSEQKEEMLLLYPNQFFKWKTSEAIKRNDFYFKIISKKMLKKNQ